jgi:sulfur carrier protein ThiS adenylyltransferase
MKIRVNEQQIEADEGATVEEVRRRVKPDADVVIHNGFPEPGSALLREGDGLVLIRRGEQPGRQELESLLVARHTPGVHAKMKEGKVEVTEARPGEGLMAPRVGVAAHHQANAVVRILLGEDPLC